MCSTDSVQLDETVTQTEYDHSVLRALVRDSRPGARAIWRRPGFELQPWADAIGRLSSDGHLDADVIRLTDGSSDPASVVVRKVTPLGLIRAGS